MEQDKQKLLQNLLEKHKAGQLKPVDRYNIPPQPMPEQDPNERIHNVNEVALGYTELQAQLEAMRCFGCKNAPCIKGCPVQIKIKDFIAAIVESNYKKALEIIKENSLSACRLRPSLSTRGSVSADLHRRIKIQRLNKSCFNRPTGKIRCRF